MQGADHITKVRAISILLNETLNAAARDFRANGQVISEAMFLCLLLRMQVRRLQSPNPSPLRSARPYLLRALDVAFDLVEGTEL